MSLAQVKPGKTIFFTDIDLDCGPDIEVVKIAPIKSKQEYSRWVIKELYKYIETEFVLLTQWDGWVLNGDQWNDEFYEYDYIGAPWIFEHNRNVGNGGFSLRSKNMCYVLGTDPLIQITHPEDQSIGILYRGYLEETYGAKFPSEELADTFAYELKCPASPTFGFHGWFHNPYQKTVVIKRTAALGDVVQTEAVLYYFFKKGYRVVLDTLPQFHNLFIQHQFKVHRPEEVDGRILETAKHYDLDFSYESKPKQLHLKTYFEFCEVPESEMLLQNPVLHLNIPKDESTKLFKKYCVIHIPDRKQNSRNIQGNLNWAYIANHIKYNKGYDVIQLSGGEDVPGALRMQTPGEPFLMWVLREADLFIGIDSGPSNIAVSFGVPSIIFFGSVSPEYIYADLSNITTIQHHNVCRSPKCWSSVVGCEGAECIENVEKPPCVQFTTEQVFTAINNITCK
jgi:ADP-heptose:LPS heptosyltransferase